MQNDDKKLPAFLMPLGKARSACLLVAVLLIVSCSSQRTLMPTPDIYARGIMQPFAETLPAELKNVDVNIMYATDRATAPRDDGRRSVGRRTRPRVTRPLAQPNGCLVADALARPGTKPSTTWPKCGRRILLM